MEIKKGLIGTIGAGVAVGLQRMGAAAQDTAASGNGGTADASGSGGAIAIGDLNTGGNTGAAISVGAVDDGSVAIDGGGGENSLSLTISSDGGTAISDASGGDSNFAFVS